MESGWYFVCSWLVLAGFSRTAFTINGELDPPGGAASCIGRRADELSTLIPRRRVDEEAAIRIQEEVWTTHIQQLSALQNIYLFCGIKLDWTRKRRSHYTRLWLALLRWWKTRLQFKVWLEEPSDDGNMKIDLLCFTSRTCCDFTDTVKTSKWVQRNHILTAGEKLSRVSRFIRPCKSVHFYSITFTT